MFDQSRERSQLELTDLGVHDQIIALAFKQLIKPGEVSLSPEVQATLLKMRLVIEIGSKLNLPANGMLGYHALGGLPFEERHPIARDNLVTVIKSGMVKPAEGYTSDLNPKIDPEGNLIDGNERQAFCAPLRLGSYFDSAGNFGPYWVIFQPEVYGSDRYNGIPAEFHRYYLVPSEVDRRYLLSKVDPTKVDSQRLGKIITYDEFISEYGHNLPENWQQKKAEEEKRLAAVSHQVMNLEERVKQLSSWEMAVTLFQSEIKNESNDEDYRIALVRNLTLIPGWFHRKYPSLSSKEVLTVVTENLLKIITDDNAPSNVRIACLDQFRNSFINEGRDLIGERDVANFCQMVGGDRLPEELRVALIQTLAGYSDQMARAKILSLAENNRENIRLRHEALFRLHPTSENVDTFLDYLKNGTPQGKKIALIKLFDLPVLIPDNKVFRAVNSLARSNKKADINFYLGRFEDKYSFLTHPEGYQDSTPTTPTEFIRFVDLLLSDFRKLDGDQISVRRRGLLIFLAKTLILRGVKLESLDRTISNSGDLIIHFGKFQITIGKLEKEGDRLNAEFGGFGVFGINPSSEHFKKIIFYQSPPR